MATTTEMGCSRLSTREHPTLRLTCYLMRMVRTLLVFFFPYPVWTTFTFRVPLLSFLDLIFHVPSARTLALPSALPVELRSTIRVFG